jgi:hypothetical protein
MLRPTEAHGDTKAMFISILEKIDPCGRLYKSK